MYEMLFLDWLCTAAFWWTELTVSAGLVTLCTAGIFCLVRDAVRDSRWPREKHTA